MEGGENAPAPDGLEGLAVKVQDAGCRIQASGFGVTAEGRTTHGVGIQCSEFRFRDAGFWVQGSWFRIRGSGFRVLGSGFRVQGSGFRVRGCRVCLLLLLGAKLLRMVGVLRRLSKLLLLLLLLRRVRGSGSFHPGRYNTREFPEYIFFSS